jgi:hypothetical protein
MQTIYRVELDNLGRAVLLVSATSVERAATKARRRLKELVKDNELSSGTRIIAVKEIGSLDVA